MWSLQCKPSQHTRNHVAIAFENRGGDVSEYSVDLTRAIENGCYVIHCANTGFSAIISPAGNFVEKLDLMDKDVLYGTVYLIPEKTFYAKYGNILLYIYLALSAATAIVYPLWKRRKISRVYIVKLWGQYT